MGLPPGRILTDGCGAMSLIGRLLVALVAAAFAAGCTGFATHQSPTPGGAATPATRTTAPTARSGPTTGLPAAGFAAIKLSGTGNKVAKFKIPEGQAGIATITHKGNSNFAVTTVGADGQELALLVNVVGS